MEDQVYNGRIYDFNVTAVGTNSGVTTTQGAVTGETYVVTSLTVSGDLAALVTIESPASTVLWQCRMTGTGWVLNKDWTHPTIKSASGAAILVKVSASTAHCEATLSGFAKSAS